MTRGRKVKFTKEQIELIEKYALMNCRYLTIAKVLGIPEQTLKDNFVDLITKKRAEGKIELRTAQREKATRTKDTAMLIFLGKNDLGQADKQTVEHGVTAESATLLGLIDGSSKGKLPTEQEAKDV